MWGYQCAVRTELLGAINHDGIGLDVGEVREVLYVVVTKGRKGPTAHTSARRRIFKERPRTVAWHRLPPGIIIRKEIKSWAAEFFSGC